MGFNAAGPRLKEAVAPVLARMLEERAIVARDDKLFLPPTDPT